ncbi:MAG TPA: hypothetical protein VFP44_15380 [Usitatibacter sp.]|nr:hypothetical protein [Usitatibacter sp.]
MIRELRADPSTQFFERILLGAALAPPQDFREHLRGEALAAHPWAAALSLGGPAPATTTVELEEESPLPR